MDKKRIETLLFMFSVLFLLSGCQSTDSSRLSSVSPWEPNLARIDGLSINDKPLNESTDEEYLIIVAGHIYGSNKSTAPHPAQSFINKLSYFADLNPSLMVLLGDIVPRGSTADFQDLEESILFDQDYPIFNAVGNHDVENRQLYEDRYGSTYFYFPYRSAYFIILDTELDNCKISGDQLEMLETSLKNAVSDAQISQIFIFTHKVLFFDQGLYQRLNNDQSNLPNDRYSCLFSHNYSRLLTDLFLPAAEIKPVYLLAGDVGAWGGNLTPYQARYQGSDFHLLTTGLGDTAQDSVIIVNIKGDRVDIKYLKLINE